MFECGLLGMWKCAVCVCVLGKRKQKKLDQLGCYVNNPDMRESSFELTTQKWKGINAYKGHAKSNNMKTVGTQEWKEKHQRPSMRLERDH